MSTIYVDVENESNKISIKTESFLIFHIPSFWDLNSLIIPHNTIDAIHAGGSVYYYYYYFLIPNIVLEPNWRSSRR
jgi:hypothetical protein